MPIVGKDASNRNYHSSLVRLKNGIAALEDSVAVSCKAKCPTIYPVTELLGSYPNELKTYIQAKTSTQIFITALFIIAQTWEQPRCLSISERIKNNYGVSI